VIVVLSVARVNINSSTPFSAAPLICPIAERGIQRQEMQPQCNRGITSHGLVLGWFGSAPLGWRLPTDPYPRCGREVGPLRSRVENS